MLKTSEFHFIKILKHISHVSLYNLNLKFPFVCTQNKKKEKSEYTVVICKIMCEIQLSIKNGFNTDLMYLR